MTNPGNSTPNTSAFESFRNNWTNLSFVGSNQLDSEFSSVRGRLLAGGLSRASRLDGRTVTLKKVAAQLEIPLEEARTEFPSESAFRQAMVDICVERFSTHIQDAWTGDTADFDFERSVWIYARGYHEFGTTDRVHFAALNALTRTTDLPPDFHGDIDTQSVDPAFVPLLEITREYMYRLNSPTDPWLWALYALTLYSGIHGITHLNTFGVTRYLSKTGKKQVLNCVVSHVMNACRVALPEGRAYSVRPHEFKNDTPIQVGALHGINPTDPIARTRSQLFDGAVKTAFHEGLLGLTIERAAATAGVSQSDALSVLTPDLPFEQQISDYLSMRMKQHLLRQMQEIQPDPHPFELGKAAGVAYVGMALTEPENFDIHTILTNRSIVPSSFAENPEEHQMGQGFELLLGVTRQGIEVGGGQRSSWTLYETTIDLWATSHGLAKLLSNGPLHALPERLGRILIDPVLNASTTSAITRLGLTAPGIADKMVPVVRED